MSLLENVLRVLRALRGETVFGLLSPRRHGEHGRWIKTIQLGAATFRCLTPQPAWSKSSPYCPLISPLSNLPDFYWSPRDVLTVPSFEREARSCLTHNFIRALHRSKSLASPGTSIYHIHTSHRFGCSVFHERPSRRLQQTNLVSITGLAP